MKETKVVELLKEYYGFDSQGLLAAPLGNGLINSTWKVAAGTGNFIFQQINTAVFKDPEAIDHNLRVMATYLQANHPDYLFTAPVKATSGKTMIKLHTGECFRLFPFVQNAISMDVVQTPEQAYKAAFLFGGFTGRLTGLPAHTLKITLPQFHDLPLRFNQFKASLKDGNPERIKESALLIQTAIANTHIVHIFEQLQGKKILKSRVTHHDTKISNVLFDEQENSLCVIDLDTVMPGCFISDTGDMLRTMLSPVSEEETDVSKIEVRDDFYQAIYHGYMDEMKHELSNEEQTLFFYSGCYMLYMQGLRFLTDYLCNDVYYGSRYPGHNFNRANNQFTLLSLLQEKESLFKV